VPACRKQGMRNGKKGWVSNKLWGQTYKLIFRNGKARASAGIYLGDGKSFETEVREAHETSRANREMSINKSDPTVPQTPHGLKIQYFL
jgi:hypothetical protein